MLELKKIRKVYVTNDLKQVALDDVSINFRKCEFASILGASGSGKTTLLNIIGGLDHYDDGDLIINEVSTKKYKDKDWDSYRNHRIGFVFQSYNLIMHQSILRNVELALTLSGVSKTERLKRAKKVLKEVGLESHINKKPNQLSGGQMQRVAIARALVNDPDILLADEPTGALDSETSKQIMDLLKKVANDKLVIMVTHNPELASEYSSRIIKLKDGHIIADTNPYDGMEKTDKLVNKKTKKTSMGLKTALSLSLNNLMTKKGRTFLTAFAGSIGIIGIALILSLSNGVQEYIDRTQKETLATYPLSIEKDTFDFTSMMSSLKGESNQDNCLDNKICTTDDITNSMMVQMSASKIENNLVRFKEKLDNNYLDINDYVTDIQYVYDLDLQIYSANTEKIVRVNPDSLNIMGNMENPGYTSAMSSMKQATSYFRELIDNEDLLNGQYDVLAGRLPNNYNEMVLVVDKNNRVPLSLIYALNVEKREELFTFMEKLSKGEDVSLKTINYDYNDLLKMSYKLVLNPDYYVKTNGKWMDKSLDINYMKEIINKAIEMKIVGIIKVAGDATSASSGYVGYTHKTTEYVINKINEKEIVKEQLKNKNINVLTGLSFDDLSSTYEKNLEMLGICNLADPSLINIYPIDYDAKEKIKDFIASYNEGLEEKDIISYTDYVGVLMSGITSIIDIITYVLVAFVAISLIVSSIMIAIITYISVLERTKEIGVLRSIGASKKDVVRVFNAETIIEGFIAGVLGIVVTIILCIPINAIVNNLTGVKRIASLPLYGGISLVIISVLLTVVAGLIPSRMASKKDPVEALRSE